MINTAVRMFHFCIRANYLLNHSSFFALDFGNNKLQFETPEFTINVTLFGFGTFLVVGIFLNLHNFSMH